jgi:hypothetical protein
MEYLGFLGMAERLEVLGKSQRKAGKRTVGAVCSVLPQSTMEEQICFPSCPDLGLGRRECIDGHKEHPVSHWNPSGT